MVIEPISEGSFLTAIIVLWLREIMIKDGNPTNLGSFLIAIVAIVLTASYDI